MSTTYSGRLLLPQNFGTPRLHDIAIQSGRLVRFSGACRAHWTVLHHLFVCRALVDLMGEAATPEAALVALLHDADEVATNDIPSLWKCKEQRALVDPLQGRVYHAYLGRLPTPEERALNKAVDRLALVAEMLEVGPPYVLEHSGMETWATSPTEDSLLEAAVHVVRGALRTAPEEAHTMRGLNSTLVLWYLRELDMCGVRNPYEEDLLKPKVEEWAATQL